MEAILIRHGITNGNIEKRYIGTTDEPLIDSEKERLRKNIYPDADIIIISPMKRCIQTAEIIYGKYDDIFDGLKRVISESLRIKIILTLKMMYITKMDRQ